MAKKATVLNADIRAAVQATYDYVASKQKEAGLAETRMWNQTVAAIAIGFAAEAHFAAGGDRKAFIKAYNDAGFLANGSQFRQALENLPDDDSLKLAASADLDL